MRRVTVMLIALLLLTGGLWSTGLLESSGKRHGSLGRGEPSSRPGWAPDLQQGGTATHPELRGTQPPVAPAAPDGAEPGAFTLRVRASDGTLVARARMRFVSDDDGSPGTVLREASLGVPAVLEEFAQPFWIEVVSAMDPAGVPLPLKRAWSGPHDPGEGAIYVLLRPHRIVAGHVFDANGRPLPSTRVVLFHKRFNQLEKTMEVTSDEQGAFRAAGLAQRSYFLTAYPGGSNAPPDPLAVQAGNTEVALRMRPGVIVTIEVVTEKQGPIAGARVSVLNSIPKGDVRIRRTVAIAHTDAGGLALTGQRAR